ncbi:MAG: type II toxin-antitoxin system VapC family toxin [Tepidisphaeraceae bacterium]
MAARGLYFDSALLAKFYLNEPGRDAVRDLAGSAGSVCSSAIAVAEVCGAFQRKLRERSINAEAFRSLSGQFAHDVARNLWTLIPLSEAILESVQTRYSHLDAKVFLRALDAIHLVTAKSEGFAQVYTNDRQVLGGCAALGLRGVNPLPA